MVGEDDFVRTDGSVLEIVERPAEGQQASALKHASKLKVKHETIYAEGRGWVLCVPKVT
jgi:hypothetical protein